MLFSLNAEISRRGIYVDACLRRDHRDRSNYSQARFLCSEELYIHVLKNIGTMRMVLVNQIRVPSAYDITGMHCTREREALKLTNVVQRS